MSQLEEALIDFTHEHRDIYSDSVPVLKQPPTSFDFYFDYISQNRPVVVQNAIKHWPALEKWKSDEYLIEKLGDSKVKVAVTPNGRADAVYENYFCMPQEVEMTYEEFSNKLKSGDSVHYIQHQNNNFEHFQPLLDDVEDEITFASNSLRASPEVMNIWIGDHKSVSSLHKDPYENIYAVVTGQKRFRLLPPTSQPFLHEQFYKQAVYHKQDKWEVKPLDEDPIPWIPVDLGDIDLQKFPKLQQVRPITVTVSAGEVLYLPALWYHQVEQEDDQMGRCIAVNYWYDSPLFLQYHSVHDMITKLSKIII
jgi:jumonji domain-containing protein 7